MIVKKNIANIRSPSYIIRLSTALSKLSPNSSDDAIYNFILRYGFLNDFNIESTTLETIEGVRKFIETPISYPKRISRMKKLGNQEQHICGRITRRIAWYEELRHYYQLRILRNFRLAFEHFGLDKFHTGIDELLESMKEG